MKRYFFAVTIFMALLLSIPALAEELEIYNKNWHLQYRVKDGRIYDPDWQVWGYLQGDEIFDNNCHLKYRIKNGQVFDLIWNLEGYIETRRIYDENWQRGERRKE
jgi:hypothetical protein